MMDHKKHAESQLALLQLVTAFRDGCNSDSDTHESSREFYFNRVVELCANANKKSDKEPDIISVFNSAIFLIKALIESMAESSQDENGVPISVEEVMTFLSLSAMAEE